MTRWGDSSELQFLRIWLPTDRKEEAAKVAKYVIKSHDAIKGIEPLTQLPFDAQSEYELALTLAVQTMGFLTAYEELHGELSTAKRDQFIQEQKILGAIIGVNPDHVPSTYSGLIGYISDARRHWAAHPGCEGAGRALR